jgi:hypothetical protein
VTEEIPGGKLLQKEIMHLIKTFHVYVVRTKFYWITKVSTPHEALATREFESPYGDLLEP